MNNKIIPFTKFCLPFVLLLVLCRVNAQEITKIKWKTLQDGLLYCELEASEKSIVNDSKLTILKVDPMKYDFHLLSASEYGKKNRTADEWAQEFGMNIVVNAGMFNPTHARTNKGYMCNYSHFNNSRCNKGYNVMMALNPKDKSKPSFQLFDLTHARWDSIKPLYHSFCQGMRMITWNGEALAWDKRPGQSCSMVIGATDIDGNIYFVFTRSPFTHQTVIKFLQTLPLNIRTTVYLEGGPEASLYINSGDSIISKYGSYVSKTYARDDNDHFWKIPNVIGVVKK
jgi:hypothetical protein